MKSHKLYKPIRPYTLATCLALAGLSQLGYANPTAQPQSIIVVQSSQGLSFGTKVLLGLATFGGVLYLDARYTGGHIIYNRLRNRLFSNIDRRLAELEAAAQAQQALLTTLQEQTTANGRRIDGVQETASRLEVATNQHTGILNNHTAQLDSMAQHVSDIEIGVQNNGTEIKATHKAVQGVRTVVDTHTGQLNDHTQQIQTVHNDTQALGRTLEQHTTRLETLATGQQQLIQGQTAMQRALERIEQASTASADSGRQTLQLLQRTAALAPTIRTITQQGNIHGFGRVE